jgi:hypothetical protein
MYKPILVAALTLTLAWAAWAVGVDVLVVSDGNQIEYEDGPGGHGFPRLGQDATGGTAAECNEAAETGQIIMDTGAVAGAKLEICTSTGWETVGGTAAGVGDNIFINNPSPGAVDDANFIDTTSIEWTLSTGPAPDEIEADVPDDGVEGNQDLLDFQDDATADTCTTTESADGSYLGRNVGDTDFECVQHWNEYTLAWYLGYLDDSDVTNYMGGAHCLAKIGNEWAGLGFVHSVFPHGGCTLNTTKRTHMEQFYIFPANLDVRVDKLVCGFYNTNITSGDTMEFQPVWKRGGNQAGYSATMATLTVTANAPVTETHYGEAVYTTGNVCGLGGSPAYARCSLAIRIVGTSFASTPDADLNITCQAFISMSEN